MIEAGANANYKSEYKYEFGYTALIYASINGHIEIVKLLLKAEVDLNDKDKYGSTALTSISKIMEDENIIDKDNKFIQIVRMLIQVMKK